MSDSTDYEPVTKRRRKVCFPTVYSLGNIDRRRGRAEHDFVPQSFYNQDWRLWCQRCGLLTERTANA